MFEVKVYVLITGGKYTTIFKFQKKFGQNDYHREFRLKVKRLTIKRLTQNPLTLKYTLVLSILLQLLITAPVWILSKPIQFQLLLFCRIPLRRWLPSGR